MSLTFFQRGAAAHLSACAVLGGLAFIPTAPAWALDLPKGVVQGPSVEGITE
jgi:zinc protease